MVPYHNRVYFMALFIKRRSNTYLNYIFREPALPHKLALGDNSKEKLLLTSTTLEKNPANDGGSLSQPGGRSEEREHGKIQVPHKDALQMRNNKDYETEEKRAETDMRRDERHDKALKYRKKKTPSQ